VDDIGDYRTVMKNKYPNLKLKDYSDKKDIFISEVLSKNGGQSKANLFNLFLSKIMH
jgi:hypothetical protein